MRLPLRPLQRPLQRLLPLNRRVETNNPLETRKAPALAEMVSKGFSFSPQASCTLGFSPVRIKLQYFQAEARAVRKDHQAVLYDHSLEAVV